MSQRIRTRYETRPEGDVDLTETSINELRSPTNAYAIPEEEDEVVGEDEEFEDEEDGEEEDDEEEEEDEEGSDESGFGSETSSMIYDQNLDPTGWAKRLDELAGVMEMGEVEVKALKWGPPIGHREVSPLPLEEFKAVLNHHLQSTEWKYATTSDLFPPPSLDLANMPLGLDTTHPIRVLGRDWTGRGPEVPGLSMEDVDMGRDPFGPTGLGIALDGGR